MFPWKAVLLTSAMAGSLTTQAQAWQEARLPRAVIADEVPRQVIQGRGVTNGAIVIHDSPLYGIDFRTTQVQTINLGDYWIGLSCDQVSDALRSHLKIEDGQGLIVRDAYEGKAAEKAGLQEHDVLVLAGDKPLSEVKDLIAAVQEAADEELTLKLIRAGNTMTLTVKPQKRPEEWRKSTVRVLPRATTAESIYRPQWITVRPGTIVKPYTPQQVPVTVYRPRFAQRPLPEGVTIRITRSGMNPVEIEVKRGDDSWKIGADEIGKLPAELQPLVQDAFGGSTGGWQPRHPVYQLPNGIPRTLVEPTPREYRLSPVQPKRVPTRDTRQDEVLKQLREELRRLGEKLDSLDDK